MKKFGYFCALLLCIPEMNHAKNPFEEAMYVGVGGLVLGGIISGLYFQRNNAKYQFKMQQAAIERERIDAQQKADTEKFHLIEKVTALEKLFCKIHETKTDQRTDLEHKKFHAKVIECAGSVTTFKKQLQTYEQAYEKLHPEAAKEHEHIITTIRSIGSELHSNHYVQETEKIETEQTLKAREDEAHIRKIESEARLSQDAAQCIKNTAISIQESKDMLTRVESKTKQVSDELERTVRHELIQLSLILDGRLGKLLSLEQQLAEQQKHNKQMAEQFSQIKQSLQNLKKEMLSELRAQNGANGNKHIEDRLSQIFQALQNIEKVIHPELPAKGCTQERKQENDVPRDNQGFPIYAAPVIPPITQTQNHNNNPPTR